MTVLSLFDGMSCGQIALRELGVPVERYYASEIDKHAIQQTQLNFPDTIQLGDVEKWREWDIKWEEIDLLLAGSPCQGFSLAGKMLGHDDPRSRLFWVFVDILEHVKGCNSKVLWLLENVRMKAEHEALINDALGLQPVVINSALVSAQNRVRLYWTNIRVRQEGLWGELHTDIPQPHDLGIRIQDILDKEVDDKYYIRSGKFGQYVSGKARSLRVGGGLSTDAKHSWDVIKLDKQLRPKTQQEKASCLTAGGHSGGNHSDMDILAIRRQPTSKPTLGICQRGRGYVRPSVYTYKSPTLTSNSWQENNMVCAIRGRGDNNEQTIELRRDNKTNALTSVMKDNLVVGVIQGFTDPPAFRPMAGDKAPTMLARARQDGSGQPCIKDDISLRRLTPKECARLQTIPEWYKWGCSDSQAYKMLGNGWTVEVIKHILSHITQRQ